MNPKLIEMFHKRAKAIGIHIGKHLPARHYENDWATYKGENLTWEYPEEGMLRFRRNEHAFIEFSNITPTTAKDAIFEEPTTLKTENRDSQYTVIKNEAHDVTVERTYSFNDEEAVTAQTDISVAAGLTVEQKVGYGVPGVITGETSVGVSLTTTWQQSNSKTTTVGRNTTTTVEVKPRHEATVFTRRNVSDLRQKCKFRCDFEAEIRLFSHGDYDHRWKSFSDLDRVLKGRAPDNLPLAVQCRKSPMEQKYIDEIMVRSFNEWFEFDIDYSAAVDGQVIVKDAKLGGKFDDEFYFKIKLYDPERWGLVEIDTDEPVNIVELFKGCNYGSCVRMTHLDALVEIGWTAPDGSYFFGKCARNIEDGYIVKVEV